MPRFLLKLENKKQRLSPKLGQSSGCESLLRVRAAREKQTPEERAQVQSQVRGRRKARVVGAGAVADRRDGGRDTSAGRSADRASWATDAAHPGKRSELPGRTSASPVLSESVKAEGAGAVNFCIELANAKKRIRLGILFMD
jgi:hypothetical protein